VITIRINPVRADEASLVVIWNSPVLTINSNTYDLSELPDEATAEHPLLGVVTRLGSDYTITLTIPHGPTAPYETRFPSDIVVLTDGEVTMPSYN